MHINFLAAVALTALAATPVVARDAAQPSVAIDKANPAKICLGATKTGDQTITGSMLNRKVCKSRTEWEASGVKFQNRPAKD